MATIFRLPASPESLNQLSSKTMVETLGIEFVEVGEDFVRARMPVDGRTIQPYGILHGGANATLAETVASVAATLCCDPGKQIAVGVELNANHIRSVRSGFVYGTARPLHLGRSTHVWDVRIEDEEGMLVCASRLTLLIKDR